MVRSNTNTSGAATPSEETFASAEEEAELMEEDCPGSGTDIDDEDEEDDEEFDPEDEDEEDDLDDEDEDDMFIHRMATPLWDVFRHGVARYPLVSEHVPPPLEGDLADEISKSKAVGSPAWRARAPHALRGAALSPAHAFFARENGLSGSVGAVRNFATHHRLPTRPKVCVDRMASRGYIGRFTADGDLFVAAFQNERKIKVYDVQREFSVVKDVHARNLRWTVTDVAISSDQRHLLYSSITPVVHLVNLDTGQRDSVANITDIHESFDISRDDGNASAIWALRWSSDAREIIAGTGDASLYIYDISQSQSVCRVHGHLDDVNAVAYAEPDMPCCPIIFTGSDDHQIKVWDRRMLGNEATGVGTGAGAGRGGGRRQQPVGVFIGHTEGVAHLDPKGDGRYLISNGKDQTVKLWDLRKGMRTPQESAEVRRHNSKVPSFSWDYRWMPYPGKGRVISHPHDAAIATYRGHSVEGTLCRAYWSPAISTGQSYIYTASSDGSVVIYDVLTCKIAAKLEYHNETVRDCSWHPHLPLLVTVAFDGCVVAWEPEPAGAAEAEADEAAALAERVQPGSGKAAARAARSRRKLSPPRRGDLIYF